jgi:hypothetical protein
VAEPVGRRQGGIRYAWHPKDKPEEVFSSKVTARKVAGEWKLDGEDVKHVSVTGGDTDYDRDGGAAGEPGEPFRAAKHGRESNEARCC